MSEQELTVEERLTEASKILEEYSKSLGLQALTYSDDVEQILRLSSTDLKNLSQEEALSYGYVLSNYAGFLAREKGSQTAKLDWANHNLNITIGKLYNNYGEFTKYEARKILICQDNEYAAALNKIILRASNRIEQVSGVSFQISKMADFLSELAKAKRYSHE